jgi:lysophospholipase L1-like esterase
MGDTSINDVVATFANNINNIVNKLRDNNKGIKIFIATIIPSYASNYNTNYKALNEKIIEIADASTDIYLLDLNTYSNITMHQAYNVWHPTPLGYVKLAEEIKALISYTMHKNLDDFKDIHLIGTDYVL